MYKWLALLLAGTTLFAADVNKISQQYTPAAQKLIDAAMSDEQSLARLQYLCDRNWKQVERHRFLGARHPVVSRRDEEGGT